METAGSELPGPGTRSGWKVLQMSLECRRNVLPIIALCTNTPVQTLSDVHEKTRGFPFSGHFLYFSKDFFCAACNDAVQRCVRKSKKQQLICHSALRICESSGRIVLEHANETFNFSQKCKPFECVQSKRSKCMFSALKYFLTLL